METMEARTHAMRALIELRKRILNGSLPGGTRLYEVALAEDLEISRTPIREAMSRLVEEGLLERGHSGGFVVRSFNFGDVIDAIELRGVLEGTAARLAAERGAADGDLARLKQLLIELDACFDAETGNVRFESYAGLNAKFHHALAALPGSKIIEAEIRRVIRLPFASPSAFLPDKAMIDTFRRSLAMAHGQHRAIVAAIAAREGARAEALAREHARTARHNLEYLLDEGRSLIPQVPGLALVVD